MRFKVTVHQHTFYSVVSAGNFHERLFFGPFHAARAEDYKALAEYRLGIYDAELAAYREQHAEAYKEVKKCRKEWLH